MKLSGDELAAFEALVRAAEAGPHRAASGLPGDREQPSSYAALLAQRATTIGVRRG